MNSQVIFAGNFGVGTDKEELLKTVRIGSRRGIGDRRYSKEDIENYIKQKGQSKRTK